MSRVSAEDGCQELIEDTADMQKAWIEKMMEKGLCSCDEEHMFDCPATAESDVSVKPTDAQQQAFDDVLERILGKQVRIQKTLVLCLIAITEEREASQIWVFKVCKNQFSFNV